MKRDDLRSEYEGDGLHGRHKKIEMGQIGFSPTTMASIYSPEDATVDLLRVMRSESVMETDRHSADKETVRREPGNMMDSKFIAFHNHGYLGS
jgi:hypothetical protein